MSREKHTLNFAGSLLISLYILLNFNLFFTSKGSSFNVAKKKKKKTPDFSYVQIVLYSLKSLCKKKKKVCNFVIKSWMTKRLQRTMLR